MVLFIKRAFMIFMAFVCIVMYTTAIFQAGRLLGSAETLFTQAQLTRGVFGVSKQEYRDYLDSAKYILNQSTVRFSNFPLFQQRE